MFQRHCKGLGVQTADLCNRLGGQLMLHLVERETALKAKLMTAGKKKLLCFV